MMIPVFNFHIWDLKQVVSNLIFTAELEMFTSPLLLIALGWSEQCENMTYGDDKIQQSVDKLK